MSGALCKNLLLFNKLCGDDAVKNVILATTKWAEVVKTVGEQRERELSEQHWKHMLDHEAKITRFTNTSESAWDIVNDILHRNQAEAVLIQKELVDLRKHIPETEVGLALRHKLEELLEHQIKELQKEKLALGNEGTGEPYKEKQKKIRSTKNEIQKLKIPLYRQILAFFAHQGPSHGKFLRASPLHSHRSRRF